MSSQWLGNYALSWADFKGTLSLALFEATDMMPSLLTSPAELRKISPEEKLGPLMVELGL